MTLTFWFCTADNAVLTLQVPLMISFRQLLILMLTNINSSWTYYGLPARYLARWVPLIYHINIWSYVRPCPLLARSCFFHDAPLFVEVAADYFQIGQNLRRWSVVVQIICRAMLLQLLYRRIFHLGCVVVVPVTMLPLLFLQLLRPSIAVLEAHNRRHRIIIVTGRQPSNDIRRLRLLGCSGTLRRLHRRQHSWSSWVSVWAWHAGKDWRCRVHIWCTRNICCKHRTLTLHHMQKVRHHIIQSWQCENEK